jgi:hypothetical protein
MRALRSFAFGLLLLAGCASTSTVPPTGGGPGTAAEKGKTYAWDFDATPAGTLPAGWLSVLGEWKTNDQALRQSAKLSGGDFPRAMVSDLSFTNLTLEVRCRPESGAIDQACGLMFRAKDSDNYFLTRANALEGNVRLYKVVGGSREQLASADTTVASNQWHALKATARGTALTVTFDNQPVISITDATFSAGKIGVWTKADSVTSFDDVVATAE